MAKKEVPKAIKVLAREVVKKWILERKGRRGRPSFGKGDIDSYVLIYALSKYGYSYEKIARLLKRIAKKMAEKGIISKEDYERSGIDKLSEKTIERRLKEIEEQGLKDKVEEELRKLEEAEEAERRRIRLVVNWKVFKELIDKVKKKEITTEELQKLIAKVSEFEFVKNDIMRFVKGDIALGSLMNKLVSAEKLYEWFKKHGKPNPKDWTVKDFDMFMIECAQKNKPSTCRKFITAFWLFRPDLKHVMAGAHAPLKKKEKGVRKDRRYVLEPHEYNTVIDYLYNKSKFKNKELIHLMLDVHITTMAREGHEPTIRGFEIYEGSLKNIKVSQIDFVNRTIDIFEPKTQTTWKNIMLDLIFPDLPERLKKYIEENGLKPNDYLWKNHFKSYIKFIKAIRKVIGKNLILHDIRRTGAYWRIKYLNVPLEAIVAKGTGGVIDAPLGVGWEDANTLMEYYVDLSSRRKRIAMIVKPYAQKLLKEPQKVMEETFEVFVR